MAVAAKRVQPRDPDLPAGVRSIRIDQVKFDSLYQRDLKIDRVQKLVRDWDRRLAGVVVVSIRAHIIWCVDGQHRLAAMREMGQAIVEAQVFEGLTQGEEADLFVKYNRNRSALTIWDLFRAETTAQDPETLDLIRITHKFGMALTNSPGPHSIQALGAVMRVYRLGGEALLASVFTTIQDLWPNERLAWGGQLITGMALFRYAFLERPGYETSRERAILERHNPVYFLRKAREISFGTTRNSSSRLVAEAIRLTYNEGLSRSKQLGTLRAKRLLTESTSSG